MSEDKPWQSDIAEERSSLVETDKDGDSGEDSNVYPENHDK
jgi:hypothetical protein